MPARKEHVQVIVHMNIPPMIASVIEGTSELEQYFLQS